MIPVRLGFVPLVDCALLAVAAEKGFFRRHGVEVELSREASWANIRDKTAIGALDGAQMLAGMPLAAAVGIDPVAPPLLAAFSLGLNGNAVTVSNNLWHRMRAAGAPPDAAAASSAAALRRVLDEERHRQRPPRRFAMVYPFAAHNYELRYWLAAAGIDPDNDMRLTVVPPPYMVEALAAGAIDGFCVGEPWNSLAVQRGLGRIVVTKYQIWNNSPEKVLAVHRSFAKRRPEVHGALLRALLQAAAWTDDAANRAELVHLLAQDRYAGAPDALLAGSLTGRLALGGGAGVMPAPDFHVFHRHAANFPWISHAAWLLAQMLRWGQIGAPVDVLAIARDVYRPDLYREAARAVSITAPTVDVKREGTHDGPWRVDGVGGAIEMGSDLFCDGRVFDAANVVAYLADQHLATPRVSLDALASLNG